MFWFYCDLNRMPWPGDYSRLCNELAIRPLAHKDEDAPQEFLIYDGSN